MGEETPEYVDRRMRDKQSIYKCLDCEDQADRGHASNYLFHRAQRGNKCPVCGGNKVQKISISVVMEYRWNKSVRFTLNGLRGQALPSVPKLQV